MDGQITSRFVVSDEGAVVRMSIKIERRAITEIDSDGGGVGAAARTVATPFRHLGRNLPNGHCDKRNCRARSTAQFAVHDLSNIRHTTPNNRPFDKMRVFRKGR